MRSVPPATDCIVNITLEVIKLSNEDGTCSSLYLAQHVTSQKQIQVHKATVYILTRLLNSVLFMFCFRESVRLRHLINYVGNTLKVRLKISNKMQQYADIYLLLNYSTCFGRPSCPSSGVHKTVVAACGTDHTVKFKSLNLYFKCIYKYI